MKYLKVNLLYYMVKYVNLVYNQIKLKFSGGGDTNKRGISLFKDYH